MNATVRAILGIQWRMLVNFYRRHGQVGFLLSVAFSAIWYGGFIGLAIAVARWLGQSRNFHGLAIELSFGFFFAFMYWQGMPLLMASTGTLLDAKKLRAYPVSPGDLFRVELLLRTLVFAEMPLLTFGVIAGILRNPHLPKWAIAAPALFAIFNIALGAGIKDLLMRLLSRKGFREVFLLGVVLITALPSFLAVRGVPGNLRQLFERVPGDFLPWVAAGQASVGQGSVAPWLLLALLAAVAWNFARWQFARNLNFDTDAARAAEKRRDSRGIDLFNWPSRIFPDPLGALVEKEIRFLSRVSRFRISFFMGFSFGLIIWLPMTTRGGTGSWMSDNFLVVVTAYSLLLLGEVCFYNCFGFDRGATQFYFVVPISRAKVLVAKNIAAAFFVVAEVALVTFACWVLRMPLTSQKIGEAACVCIVLTLFLLGIGNLGSTRSPRASNPNDGWKRTSSKISLLAFACYPLMMLPIGLAYLARWAFRADAAFYAAMVFAIFLAGSFYWVSLDTATETMDSQREEFLTLLTQTDSPAV